MKPEERFTQVLVGFLMAVAFLVVGHLATTNSPSSVRAENQETSQTDTVLSPPTLVADEKSSNGQSIADLTKTTEPAPEDPNAYMKRARAYVENGEYYLAMADYTKVIQLDPEDPKAYWRRSNAYLAKGQWDLAIADLTKAIQLATKAIQLAPQDPRAHDNLFLAHLFRGHTILCAAEEDEYDLAIADFTKIIQLKPEYPSAYHFRGAAYVKIDEYDLAIADFTKVIELKPQSPDGYLWRGGVYAKQGEYHKAMKDILKAQSLGATVNPKHLKAFREALRAASNYFTLGSHKDDVLKVQGTPDSINRWEILDREVWWYGLSTVEFTIRDNRVIEWDNNGELKVKLGSSKDFISRNRRISCIVGTEDKLSAMIGTEVVGEGDIIDGVTVVEIYEDRVVFEKSGERWIQKAGEASDPAWR